MAKPKQVSGWDELPDDLFQKFSKAVEALLVSMVPRDVDNDYPFSYVLVDKRVESLSARPVPRNEVYSYETHGYLELHSDRQRELDNEMERALSLNLELATRDVERYFSERNRKFYDNKEKREHATAEAKKPMKQRINEACEYCAAGIPFQSPESITRQDRVPPKISWKHDMGAKSNALGGGYCKAYGLRRLEAGIPEDPKPMPRWCQHPKCRARLRDENSRKGVEDKDICLNPMCPTRKTKAVKAAIAKAKKDTKIAQEAANLRVKAHFTKRAKELESANA